MNLMVRQISGWITAFRMLVVCLRYQTLYLKIYPRLLSANCASFAEQLSVSKVNISLSVAAVDVSTGASCTMSAL